MNYFKLFIVEDDPFYGELLKRHLQLNPDNEVFLYKNGRECLDNIHLQPDLISLDYGLPDISGSEVMKKVHIEYPDLPIVIVSGQEDVKTAIELLKKGAYDYFVKDNDTKDRLWNLINKLREREQLKTEIDVLKEEVGIKYSFNNIKGNSQAIKNVFKLIDKAQKTGITVSITGETGTGKELVAKAIHYNSTRRNFPIVAVNVAAVPSELIESEMFGYEKGAFTGANTRKIGKFEQANKGTLFLDEIGEMDLNMQAKLLRVLQEKELTRVGGNEVIKLDSRIIVSTNRNLGEEVKKGTFREDLYYRLLGLPIELPPLRSRGNDIIFLAKYFIDEFCKENKIALKKISPDANDKLIKYSYPGNVRELKAVIELAVVLSDDEEISSDNINFNSTDSVSNFLVDECTLTEFNSRIIRYFLDKYDGNVMLAAKKLDVGKSTIYRMLKNKEL
ncbi:MAG: sigma-54-dependent Fis family transcriptional regulator [Bacteroidetes bacterium]|nr:sigma-54-dependent Fis family transcriptional regulator [Bacteroidota bacterium]MBL6943281.1 sigma-54-dependent Fis family transcriptional regulator [Bacteroidales bacterium]